MSDYWRILDNIKAAASTDRDMPITGPHCDKCYRRTHCSAWMLPAALGETALAPFTVPNGITKKNAPQVVALRQSLKDMYEIVDAKAKDFARDNGGIESEDGSRVWAPTSRRGRRSISVDKVEAAGLLQTLEEAGCVSEGGTYDVYAWRTASAAKKAAKGSPSEYLPPRKAAK